MATAPSKVPTQLTVVFFFLSFSTRILFVRLSYLAVAFGPDMDLMASLDGTLMRPPLDP